MRVPYDGEAFSSHEQAEWIRRTFLIGGKTDKVRLYITARGLFEINLNGQWVGNDYFANGWASYSKRLDTLTYDVHMAEVMSTGQKNISPGFLF